MRYFLRPRIPGTLKIIKHYGNSNKGKYRLVDGQDHRQRFERRLSAVFRENAETIWQAGEYSRLPERDGSRRAHQKDVRQLRLHRRSAKDRGKRADHLYVQRKTGDLRPAASPR